MKNIRYINMGGISGVEIAAEQEITKHIELESPMITIFYAKKPTLTMTGNYDVNEYLIADKIPDDVDIVRIYNKKGKAGSLCLDENTMFLHLHIPINMLQNNGTKFILASFSRVMRQYNIILSKSPHRIDSNDLVIKEAGIYKKVVGIFSKSYRKEWIMHGTSLCFKPNLELMEQVYKMDTDKMKSRKTSKMEDAVSGIGDFDKNKIMFEIAELIAERISLDLVISKLTVAEKKAMDNSIKLLSTKEWIYNAKR